MRFLTIAAPLLLAPAAPALAAPALISAAEAARCPGIFNRAHGSQKATVHKLGQLPPANTYLAVYRRGLDGCVEPVITGYGYGSADRAATPAPAPRRR